MTASLDKLSAALAAPYERPVYYLASTEEAPLLEAAALARTALLAHNADADVTRIDGPVPSIGDVIGAAGAISFFGTPRVVELRLISPSTMTEKDAEELASLFSQLENAVLIITALYKDKKTATSKKAKCLMDAALKIGFAGELAKPTRRDNIAYINERAAGLGARFEPAAADALLDRAGDNRNLLSNEVAKLSAVSGYGLISVSMVEKLVIAGIEADVFELARLITGGRRAAAYAKLQDLFSLKHEPIAISAAISGTFVDMYRARCGEEKRLKTSEIFREMGYRGNEYRLQKAKETAARYSTPQLEKCILCLSGLDASLKSSALSNKGLLVEAAVARLLQIGEKR